MDDEEVVIHASQSESFQDEIKIIIAKLENRLIDVEEQEEQWSTKQEQKSTEQLIKEALHHFAQRNENVYSVESYEGSELQPGELYLWKLTQNIKSLNGLNHKIKVVL